MAGALAESFAQGLPPTALGEQQRRLEGVTALDVQNAAITWFSPGRIQTVLATDPGFAAWLDNVTWYSFDSRTVRHSTAPE